MFTEINPRGRNIVYAVGKQKTVSAVRLDEDQLTRISAIASERRIGVSTFIRQLVDVALGMRPGDPSPFALPPTEPPADTVTSVPLAAAGVGAGAGQLEEREIPRWESEENAARSRRARLRIVTTPPSTSPPDS